MIVHTASNSLSAFTRPVLVVGQPVIPSSHGASQNDNAQNHAQFHPTTFTPIDPLSETDHALSGTSESSTSDQPSVALDDEDNLSQGGDGVRESKAEKQALAQEQDEISQLASRDREVRAHEQAHAAIGGQYAGSPTYSFQRGPDGVRYAVGGEVSIDTGKAATPEETIRKAQVVRQAALAPAEPSPQDRRVAAEASQIQAEAVLELRTQKVEEGQEQEVKTENDDVNEENSGTHVDGRQADLFSATDVSGEKSSNDTTANTDFTNTLNNIIGSRTYQSIASLATSPRDNHSVLDQII